jgi:myosin-5
MSAQALTRMNEVFNLQHNFSCTFLSCLDLLIQFLQAFFVLNHDVCAHSNLNHHVWLLSFASISTSSERWRIGPSSDYHYINRSGCFDVPQLDSRVEFGALKRALAVAGIAPPEQQLMFTLIAALLHLGNTAYFFDAESVDTARLTESGVQNLTWVAYLLQVDATTLMQSVLYRENVINGEIFAVPLSLAQV